MLVLTRLDRSYVTVKDKLFSGDIQLMCKIYTLRSAEMGRKFNLV